MSLKYAPQLVMRLTPGGQNTKCPAPSLTFFFFIWTHCIGGDCECLGRVDFDQILIPLALAIISARLVTYGRT